MSGGSPPADYVGDRKLKKIRFTFAIIIFGMASAAYASGSVGAHVLNSLLAQDPPHQAGFPVTLAGSGHVRYSSPALGDLTNNGRDEIVVGATDGSVHVYDRFGNELWVYDTGSMAIEGKAAIADINQDGWNEVVIGAGSTFTPLAHGGLYVLNHNGNLVCKFESGDFNKDGWRDGVFSSPAVADIDANDGGKKEIIYGGYDAHIRVLNHDCSVVWQKFVRDTVWSSPAIGDLDRDGFLDIVIGADAHAEPNQTPVMHKGGRLYAYDRFGNDLPGFFKETDEVIYSSPALGDITGDGWLEVVVGTGYFWANPNCGHPQGCTPGVGKYMNAWDHNGNPVPGWPRNLNTQVFASPALADIDNDQVLEVVVNAEDGQVHAWNGNGSYVPGWPSKPVTPASCGSTHSVATRSSPVVADVTGDGDLDVLVSSNWEIVVFNRNGKQITRDSACPDNDWHLGLPYTISSTPAIADIDHDGDVEAIVGGAISGATKGTIYAWDMPASVDEQALSWPVFRYKEDNHARSPLPPSLVATPASIFAMYESGDKSTQSSSIMISNAGDGSFTWSANTSSWRVSASPNDGQSNLSGTPVQITIDAGGLSLGLHSFSVTIDGQQGTNQIIGSPITIPVSVKVVPNIVNIFIPATAR